MSEPSSTPPETTQAEPTTTTTPPQPTPTETQPSTTTQTSTTEPKSVLNTDDKPAGAPESYADFTAPEGFELNKETLAAAAPIFKELNLTQDQAQRLVTFYAEQAKASADAPYDLWDQTQKEWRDATLADPDLGKNLPAIKETLGRAYDAIGDAALVKEFKEVMDLTGAGNHKAFVKMMYAMAQRVTEGKHVSGRAPSPFGQSANGTGRPSPAQSMYPNLPSSG